MSDIVIVVVVLLAAVGGGWFARSMTEKRREEKRRADALEAKDDARKDSEAQDDPSLVDRLTRRR